MSALKKFILLTALSFGLISQNTLLIFGGKSSRKTICWTSQETPVYKIEKPKFKTMLMLKINSE